MRNHLLKVFSDLAALLLASVLLWQHLWFAAIFTAVFFTVLGTVLASRHLSGRKLQRTLLGGLLTAVKPMDFLTEVLGTALFIVGVWNHQWITIMVGFVVVTINRAVLNYGI